MLSSFKIKNKKMKFVLLYKMSRLDQLRTETLALETELDKVVADQAQAEKQGNKDKVERLGYRFHALCQEINAKLKESELLRKLQ
jgi:hypothetical protein